jgi:epoxyqueuosine reductase QueG
MIVENVENKGVSTAQRKRSEEDKIANVAKDAGGDLIGICSARRANELATQLIPIYEAEDIISSDPINKGIGKYLPKVRKIKRKVLKPEDYIAGARSVIAIGVHFPFGILRRAGKPPSYSLMPASLMSDQTLRHAGAAAWGVIGHLRRKGYKAIMTFDLFNCSSYVLSITGEQYDATANNFVASICGLGEIARNGTVVTPDFGIAQRFVAVITDADLCEDGIFDDALLVSKCIECDKCIQACPTEALDIHRSVELNIEGKKIEFMKVDRLKCDWAKRYGLVQDEGTWVIGMETNVHPSENPDEKEFGSALEQLDPLQRGYVIVGERCIFDCPYSKGMASEL